MGDLYSESEYKQKWLVLEEKNRLLELELKRQKIICERVEKEKNRLLSTGLKQILINRFFGSQNNTEQNRIIEDNLTWVLILDSFDAVNLCKSFCVHHPTYSGKIHIVDALGDEAVKNKILSIMSLYSSEQIKEEVIHETVYNEYAIINAVINKIETDWVLYISSKFFVSEAFLNDLYDELSFSGCHFMNLPVAPSDSLKAIKQKIELVVQWEEGREYLIIPSSEERISDIPYFTRIFSGNMAIFNKNTFINFGKYMVNYGSICDIEFSTRILSHNYAIANFIRPVLVRQNNKDWQYYETDIEKYNREVGKLKFSDLKPSLKKKMAIVIDQEGWAYHNIAVQLKKNLKNMEVDIFCSNYADSIIELFFVFKRYDVVHVLWRGILQYLNPEMAKLELQKYGLTFDTFKNNFLNQICLTTAVYDHLYIDQNTSGVTENILSLVDEYTVSSEKLFDIYEKKYEKKPTGEITDGVDLELFYPENLERFEDISDRKVKIGWVGNSVFWGNKADDLKGVHTILNPALNELQKEGVRVEKCFADKQEKLIPHEKMREYYSSIDIYICSSRIEGTPNPVLEAMACGVPIISTNVGIVPEVFGEYQKQFILEKRNVECLKSKIRKMISEPINLKKCSKENIDQIQNWNWKKKCIQYENFFESALARKVSRRME